MSERIPDTLLAEALRTPWMITEDGLALVMSVISRTNITPEALALRDGDPLPRRISALRADGTLVLPVIGPIVRRADMFSKISGATDLAMLRDELASALDMNAVQRVLLMIDSPGGEVTGVTELARLIRAADASKPIYAYVEGTGASAAYYLASAAREISGAPMSVTGSIGVRMAITKRKADSASGTTFEFVSSQSPNKATDPETDAGRAQIQQIMDDLAAVFLADVGDFRGLSAEDVQRNYGEGGVFAASRALSMGLIDRIETQDAVLARIAAEPSQPAGRAGSSRARASAATTTTEGLMEPEKTPVATAAADTPPVVTQPDAQASAVAPALANERTRITQLLTVGRVSLDAGLSSAITDGTSAADYALAQALAAPSEPTVAPKGNQEWQDKRAADENALQAAGMALPNAGAADADLASEAAVIARITSAHAQTSGAK